ncbi:hypothetical protein [Neobacillus sp. OS1-33]|uniref:hypothetical protein n=1 Tax=Neobacillus sp. OS1-33 TaxID=3070683 RepID=UPI0027E1076E|nr:hypothetical protein [Neobacillus sp. OS1-33]WML26174.1 hypothetical protein RCG22_00555 [Neobacillus sp. OS1-33]
MNARLGKSTIRSLNAKIRSLKVKIRSLDTGIRSLKARIRPLILKNYKNGRVLIVQVNN